MIVIVDPTCAVSARVLPLSADYPLWYGLAFGFKLLLPLRQDPRRYFCPSEGRFLIETEVIGNRTPSIKDDEYCNNDQDSVHGVRSLLPGR